MTSRPGTKEQENNTLRGRCDVTFNCSAASFVHITILFFPLKSNKLIAPNNNIPLHKIVILIQEEERESVLRVIS